ncbi:MAG TPA: hypothetical protein VGN46_19860 [Luteibacter sp.]|jgi:hypothetical protein|uniref:hypothetical protein n=1 Tax=Luteibacter sp. TaxID=1886636 RepID=UPI002F3EACD0
MRITLSHAIGGYAAVMTLAVIWLGTSAMAAPTSPPAAARFTTIDVQRINVREPDGTLRMVVSNHASMPGYIVGKKEFAHPNRPEAGMIFYNNEGIENGGLVFDGKSADGKPMNSGSFTFDRYRQDQTIQMETVEDGAKRHAGFSINDRSDEPLDVEALLKLRNQPPSPALNAAVLKAGGTMSRRAWLGRSDDGKAALVLSDPQGRPRLTLSVAEDGTPSVDFLDAAGKITRTLRN